MKWVVRLAGTCERPDSEEEVEADFWETSGDFLFLFRGSEEQHRDGKSQRIAAFAKGAVKAVRLVEDEANPV